MGQKKMAYRGLRRQALEKTGTPSSSAANSRTTSRNVSRHASDEEDGNMSDSTNMSVTSIDDMLTIDAPAEDANEEWKQWIGDRIVGIIERKGSNIGGRETSLDEYNKGLMKHYALDDIRHQTSELFPAFLKSVRTESSEKETCLALRAIALTLITVPSETVYDAISQTLKSSYTDSEFPNVKAIAIHTLSAAAIYGGASDIEVEEIMDDLLEIIESDGVSVNAEDNGDVVVAACEAWGFLATSIDDIEEKTEAAMDAFVEQLESSDVAVQIAAGENIALLYEKSYTQRETEDGPAIEQEDEEGYPIDNSHVKRYEVYRQKHQLEHLLSQLANESSRRIAKKNRKLLHTNFADILNTVQHPTRGPRYQKAIDQETGRRYGSRLTVRISNAGYMEINKWWKLHILQALRRFLGGGIVVHYMNNEVVYESLPSVA